MFSRSKKPTVKKSAIVEETPLLGPIGKCFGFYFYYGILNFWNCSMETIRADLII